MRYQDDFIPDSFISDSFDNAGAAPASAPASASSQDVSTSAGAAVQNASAAFSVASADQDDTLRFRDAMSELNDIVALLESNTLELEESLVKYERAIYLLRFLRTRLTQAQQKVDVLMGQLDESPADATVDTTLSKA